MQAIRFRGTEGVALYLSVLIDNVTLIKNIIAESKLTEDKLIDFFYLDDGEHKNSSVSALRVV